MKVKDCMCTDVCCVKPETKISDIAKIMCEKHIGSVPVCDSNDCLCGIVTDRDIILRTVACEKDLRNHTSQRYHDKRCMCVSRKRRNGKSTK